jgi:hypothetical protein
MVIVNKGKEIVWMLVNPGGTDDSGPNRSASSKAIRSWQGRSNLRRPRPELGAELGLRHLELDA